MLTKQRSKQLQIGDYIYLFNRWRRIEDIGRHPRGNLLYFYFDKVKGTGYTIYTNYDLKYKVKAVLKVKR